MKSPKYILNVFPRGSILMEIIDGNYYDSFSYQNWNHLLGTQTFSPYARIFVRKVEDVI